MIKQRAIDIVRFEHVSVRYGHSVFNKTPFVLNDITYSIQLGGFYFLTGMSGVGKTTLLKLIYKDICSSEGVISAFGKNLNTISPDDMAIIRQKMGLIFQDGRLVPHLNILDNVMLPLRASQTDNRSTRRNAIELLEWAGIKDRYKDFPSQLSDGERQRVAIVRAIITHPFLILADEPTGNLDLENSFHILRLFEELSKNGTTIIMATHNMKLLEKKSTPFTHLTLDKGKLKVYQPGSVYAVNF
jgi:cell division transport system ATP-binding protein